MVNKTAIYTCAAELMAETEWWTYLCVAIDHAIQEKLGYGRAEHKQVIRAYCQVFGLGADGYMVGATPVQQENLRELRQLAERDRDQARNLRVWLLCMMAAVCEDDWRESEEVPSEQA